MATIVTYSRRHILKSNMQQMAYQILLLLACSQFIQINADINQWALTSSDAGIDYATVKPEAVKHHFLRQKDRNELLTTMRLFSESIPMDWKWTPAGAAATAFSSYSRSSGYSKWRPSFICEIGQCRRCPENKLTPVGTSSPSLCSTEYVDLDRRNTGIAVGNWLHLCVCIAFWYSQQLILYE